MSASSSAATGMAVPQLVERVRSRAADAWRAHRLTIVLSAGLFAWLTLLGALQPLTPDEAVYKIVSTGMLHGQWPYHDLFDHKPPLAYAWYVPMALGGSIELQRALAAALTAASVPLFGSVARRWLDGRAARLATVSFALMLANPGLSVRANLESFALLPLVAALAAPSPLAAGALFGVAVMTKPMALLFAPMLWLAWRRDAWKAALAMIAVCAAVSAPFAPVWRDYVTANVWFNLDYGRADGGRDLASMLSMPAPVLIGSLPLWGAAIAGAIRCRDARLWLFLACGIAATKLSGQEFDHYYVLLLPPAAMLAGRGLEWALERRPAKLAVVAAAALAVGPILAGSVTLVQDYDRIHHPLANAQEAIDASPGELYVLADHAQPYVHVGRAPQRRFFYDIPLSVRPAWGEEMHRELVACPPAVLVTSDELQFPVPWRHELTALYGRRIGVEGGTVYLNPSRRC